MGGFQMRPSSLFEFGSVALNPSPNGGVIHPRVSLLEKLLDLAIGKRVALVPADGTENGLGSKVAPLKDRTFSHDRRMLERLELVLATDPPIVMSLCRTAGHFRIEGRHKDLFALNGRHA
jgi:hypothetical protein